VGDLSLVWVTDVSTVWCSDKTDIVGWVVEGHPVCEKMQPLSLGFCFGTSGERKSRGNQLNRLTCGDNPVRSYPHRHRLLRQKAAQYIET